MSYRCRVNHVTTSLALAAVIALAACGTRDYPSGPYGFDFDSTIANLSFDALDDDGAPTVLQLSDYYTPNARTASLLVLRAGAGWCGTCRWHLQHTGEMFALDLADRLTLVDLQIADDDNLPATRAALASYRAKIDQPKQLAIDPTFQLAPAITVSSPLPLFVILDRRTMRIVEILNDPDPDLLDDRLHLALADLDGTPFTPREPTTGPDKIHRNHWDLLRDMALPGAPPPDPTNQWADSPAAAALGKTLFMDATLSPSGSVSCATCHDPTKSFTDGRPQSQGVSLVDRNAPSILFAAHARWQFWDGRADTLWAQALGPIEAPNEMGATRLSIAHAMFDRYRAAYEPIFGALPPLDDAQRFPPSGKPGDAAWDAMAEADRDAATRVFVNVGKAIAAHERTFRATPNALDRYIAGDLGALDQTQKDSLHSFLIAGCPQCHYGPRLTDDAFHVLRFPTGRQDGAGDPGRDGARALLAGSEFLASGAYSDDPTAARQTMLPEAPSLLGAFKTPPLRGVANTAPYGHGGMLPTILDVAKLYGTSGLPPSDPKALGTREVWLPRFFGGHALTLVDFLELLTATPQP